MLQDPADYVGLAIEAQISADHFYMPHHAILFRVLVEKFEKNEVIEFVSLVQNLLDSGMLEKMGGPSGLADIFTYAPGHAHFRHHCGILHEKFILRRLAQSCGEIIGNVYDNPAEPWTTLDEAERTIMAIRAGATVETENTMAHSVGAVVKELEDLINGRTEGAGLPTGFADLDRMTAGLRPGDVFVVAARPSMGKTAFMMNIVENVCLDQHVPVQVFSAEMSKTQLASRLIYSRSKFNPKQISRGVPPNKGDLGRVKRAVQETLAAKLFVDDTAGISINALRAIARRQKKEHNIGLIAIDYLQLLKSGSKQALNSREREISEISAGIKGLAKELGVPIILLAQLNRGPESRTGAARGKPRLSDLRESGSIEQDADMVGLLYREAYYADDEEERHAVGGKAELVLAKNRNGETGNIPLSFVADLMRFETADRTPAPQQANSAPRSRHD
jgi:replicative DNA helicase